MSLSWCCCCYRGKQDTLGESEILKIFVSGIYQGNREILLLLESLTHLPENAILVSANVTLLYTNIPHEQGIQSIANYMKLHVDALLPIVPSPHIIRILLETILRNSNLASMGRHFLQLVVSPYLSPFMGYHKRSISDAFLWSIPLWKRVTPESNSPFNTPSKRYPSYKWRST